RLRSREFRQAMLRPPIACTSCATATLDTVARPMWLSGIRNVSATAVSTPIWWRTRRRSGLVGGSISQISRNGGAVMRVTTGERAARHMTARPVSSSAGLRVEQAPRVGDQHAVLGEAFDEARGGGVVHDRQRPQVVGADGQHAAVVVAALLLDGPGVPGDVG